jgi:hypothetical protein
MPGGKSGGPSLWVAARRAVCFLGLTVVGSQADGKTPRALALVTACVRLWTPSLP